jgi:hypothetical protein
MAVPPAQKAASIGIAAASGVYAFEETFPGGVGGGRLRAEPLTGCTHYQQDAQQLLPAGHREGSCTGWGAEAA